MTPRYLTIALTFGLLATPAIAGVSPAAAACCARPPELVGQTYAPSLAIDVDGDRLVVSVGGSVIVVDVSDPRAPRFLGRSAPLPDTIVDLDLVADIAYVAAGEAGLRMLDVSDPGAIAEVGALDTPGLANGVVVRGGTALVAAGEAGMRIVDVRDPRSPREVGSVDTPGVAVSLAVNGRIVYVADFDGGLRVLDVVDPTAPREIGWVIPSSRALALDVAYSGGHAMVTTSQGTLWRVNVAYATTPREVQLINLDSPSTFSVAMLQGWVTLAGTGLHLMDPGARPRIYLYGTTERYFALATDARYVYAVDSRARLTVFDATIPVSPIGGLRIRGTGTLPLLGSDEHLSVDGDRIVAGGGNVVRIMDVSDRRAPREVGRAGDDAPPRAPVPMTALSAWGPHALVGRGEATDSGAADKALDVFDLSAADRPRRLALIPLSEAPNDIARLGDRAYVATGTSTIQSGTPMVRGALHVFDVADPARPREVGSLVTDASFTHVGVRQGDARGGGAGDRLYTAGLRSPTVAGSSTVPFLAVVDVSNPTRPALIGEVDLAYTAAGLRVAGARAYVALDGQPQATGGFASEVVVYDVSDPRVVRPLGAVTVPGIARALAVVDDHVFVATRVETEKVQGGGRADQEPGAARSLAYLHVVDARQPAQPVILHSAQVPLGDVEPYDLAVDGGYAVLATGPHGLWIFDVNGGDGPVVATPPVTATQPPSPTAAPATATTVRPSPNPPAPSASPTPPTPSAVASASPAVMENAALYLPVVVSGD